MGISTTPIKTAFEAFSKCFSSIWIFAVWQVKSYSKGPWLSVPPFEHLIPWSRVRGGRTWITCTGSKHIWEERGPYKLWAKGEAPHHGEFAQPLHGGPSRISGTSCLQNHSWWLITILVNCYFTFPRVIIIFSIKKRVQFWRERSGLE